MAGEYLEIPSAVMISRMCRELRRKGWELQEVEIVRLLRARAFAAIINLVQISAQGC
jgi:hypothetical protein